ncbi:hypothetical protein [Candidatus Aalborgicola defluviihabitans]|nr:hypothetical protein [Burkholderiales bacterium]
MPIAQYEKAVAERYDSDILKAGVVFSPEELKSEFGLTGEKQRIGISTT